VPGDKRARKRTARDAKAAAKKRQHLRRQIVRAVGVVVVVGALGAGIVFLVTRHRAGPPAPAAINRAQLRVDQLSAAAGCPDKAYTEPKKRSWSTAPRLSINPSKSYAATVVTDNGNFTIALDATTAPKSVNNFVFLADHGFFNCLIFIRAVPSVYAVRPGVVHHLDAYAEFGVRPGSSTGGPQYHYSETQAVPPGAQAAPGTVVMIDLNNNAARPSYGGLFSILLGSSTGIQPLPAGAEPFGYVSSGLDELQEISSEGNPTPGMNGSPPRVVHRIFRITVSAQ
jgi:cyclophilin family peptidyl-prolyl cis-trans isomerase